MASGVNTAELDLLRDQKFESIFLQRGVTCEPEFSQDRTRRPVALLRDLYPRKHTSAHDDNAFRAGDRMFESMSLQRRVSGELRIGSTQEIERPSSRDRGRGNQSGSFPCGPSRFDQAWTWSGKVAEGAAA